MLRDDTLARVTATLLLLVIGAKSSAAQRSQAVAAPARSRPPAAPLLPERAVRRDLPISPMLRQAFVAGTRDSNGRPGPRYWQLWADYTIEARLDPATATITGRERVVIHNTSDSALSTVVLRLDQNIYAPTALRVAPIPEITEGMQLTRLLADGQAIDLTDPTFTTTSAHVPWPVPIAPHHTATLDVEWHFRVPHVTNGRRDLRMGRWGDTLYQVAQWYPRVAVFDDLRERGWDREPYLGVAEFYNNFGRFDVRLDVPAGWLVGATGMLQNPEQVLTPAVRARLAHILESDSVHSIVSAAEVGAGQATAAAERLIWHFVADTASDVAWATSPRYVWDATRAIIPGRGAVPIHLLYLPGHAPEYAGAGPISQHALQFYSKLWLPYAFPQLTVVDGPTQGMEYPMLIMSSETAADHEVGHQWWPMMVGTNETWYGWMDEGFNDYMNLLSKADLAGQPLTRAMDGVGQPCCFLSELEPQAPLMWDANYAGPQYYTTTYQAPGKMLSMLGGVVGDTAVWRAMQAYAQAWRFKHPSPWDFTFFMNRALGQDLDWLWYPWLFTAEKSVDGGIERVRSMGRRTVVTMHQQGRIPAPVVLKVEFAARGPALKAMPNSVVVDSVTALVTYPVDVWFTGRRTFTATLDFGGRKIERLTLDPEARFPDRDLTDNVWPKPPAAEP